MVLEKPFSSSCSMVNPMPVLVSIGPPVCGVSGSPFHMVLYLPAGEVRLNGFAYQYQKVHIASRTWNSSCARFQLPCAQSALRLGTQGTLSAIHNGVPQSC